MSRVLRRLHAVFVPFLLFASTPVCFAQLETRATRRCTTSSSEGTVLQSIRMMPFAEGIQISGATTHPLAIFRNSAPGH